jgi:SNF2 family DNA or RNA helicase
MYSLLEAMDRFNALPPSSKTSQASWLAFATVKGCAREVGATLDSTLRANDVIIPSVLGLDIREDKDGALTFLPKCAELSTEEFQQVFERNAGAERLYSLDRPGSGRVRILLTDQQREVLDRMKRVRRYKGAQNESLKRDPGQLFEGVIDHIELPYGDRVVGIGQFDAVPVPRSGTDSEMAKLWKSEAEGIPDAAATPTPEDGRDPAFHGPVAAENSDAPHTGTNAPDAPHSEPTQHEAPDPPSVDTPTVDTARVDAPAKVNQYLLIDTHEESIPGGLAARKEHSERLATAVAFERPEALRTDRELHPHQRVGVAWLQTCSRIPGRKGVLLADDMGVGKTIQVLTFLAWAIESGKFPDLAKHEPPFRPILIIAPLILIDTRTWEKEMENFFVNAGAVFWPVLSLHGGRLADFRREDAEGAELQIGKPVLDLDRIQRHRVVITNYETVRNYQHSFAYLRNGQSAWSCVVSDEAQEYKIPSSRISHAMKALVTDLHVSCTGTPVETRLLDLWNLSNVFQPGLLGSAREFVQRYEDTAGAELDLKRKLLFQQPDSFLLRRTKLEVASLPGKTVIKLDCWMSDREVAAHQALRDEAKAGDGSPGLLAALHRFALLYQHPALLSQNAEDLSASDLILQSTKLQALIATLHAVRGKREKAIVFARHRAMQSMLQKVLEAEFGIRVGIINGDTKLRAGSRSGSETRTGKLNDFRQKLGFNILVLSPFVAGIGLTIVEANHVVHYGRWWNPAVESQATDRAYRIGQTKEVKVYIPILRDRSGRVSPTFDERLDTLMERRQRLADDFLSPLPTEEQLGRELFDDLKG